LFVTPETALTCAQVERAFTLWKNGQITITDVKKDEQRGKATTLGIRKAINKATGKESLKALSFGDTNWGQSSRAYMESINGLPERAWERILQGAAECLKSADRERNESSTIGNGDGVDEKRAQLRYISDGDDDGKYKQAVALNTATYFSLLAAQT
jgi:hypothetical protein